MHILLTNDDGVHAPGLGALCRRFARKHTVSVIAPEREQSAVGHAITLHKPLRVIKISIDEACTGFAVNGTPVDCVKLGVLELLDSKPDMVIAGINSGANVGVNINYSGTIAAAKEAALYGIAAIAVSVRGHGGEHYEDAAAFIEQLAAKVVENRLPFGTFLNVNLPDVSMKETAGIRISKLGISFFPEYIEKRMDPRNRIYYWQGSDSLTAGDNPDIDGTVICENYISITPLKCDMTDYVSFEALKGWGLKVQGKLLKAQGGKGKSKSKE